MNDWLVATDVAMTYIRSANVASRVDAIRNISLSVAEGAFVTLVGPSGCGKTTFLKILNGLLEPTAGQVLLKGRPIASTIADRAMVFQDASLLPWFTVIRNVGYGLECAGVPRKKATIEAQRYIEIVGLAGFEAAYPHELSGGMQQRANLARALAVNPAVLLMDEPFASLDAQTREFMQAELLSIWHAAKKTVVFITHQIDEAIYLSDQVVVLSPRPGTVLDVVNIEIPRPRGLEVKRTDQFREYEDHVWGLLQSQRTTALDDSATGDALRAG